jgi:hypothetical protein
MSAACKKVNLPSSSFVRAVLQRKLLTRPFPSILSFLIRLRGCISASLESPLSELDTRRCCNGETRFRARRGLSCCLSATDFRESTASWRYASDNLGLGDAGLRRCFGTGDIFDEVGDPADFTTSFLILGAWGLRAAVPSLWK